MGYVTNNHIWNGERDFERYVRLEEFYYSIKNRFMPKGTYHWSVKRFDIFVERNKFDYDNCVTVLEDYCELYEGKFKTSDGLIKFVTVLKERKLKKQLKQQSGFRIKENNKDDIKKFIVDYTDFLTNRTEMDATQVLKKIYEEFAVGYAEATLPDIYRKYKVD